MLLTVPRGVKLATVTVEGTGGPRTPDEFFDAISAFRELLRGELVAMTITPAAAGRLLMTKVPPPVGTVAEYLGITVTVTDRFTLTGVPREEEDDPAAPDAEEDGAGA